MWNVCDRCGSTLSGTESHDCPGSALPNVPPDPDAKERKRFLEWWYGEEGIDSYGEKRGWSAWLARAREENDQLKQAMALLERAYYADYGKPEWYAWREDFDKLQAQVGGEGE